jgi:hypothetical protein
MGCNPTVTEHGVFKAEALAGGITHGLMQPWQCGPLGFALSFLQFAMEHSITWI